MPKVPKMGSAWVGEDGRTYNVLLITNLSAPCPERHPVTVVYRDVLNIHYSRPLADFHNEMTEVKQTNKGA